MDEPKPTDFFQSVLNSIDQQMALVSDNGEIQWVNQAWKDFSEANGGVDDQTGCNVNYYSACKNSCASGDKDAVEVLAGFDRVISGDDAEFHYEYPCHSATEQRWFMMRFHPLDNSGHRMFVVLHQNITARKLMEIEVNELSTQDSLTGVANRRRFDEFLEQEWRHNQRLNSPLSLAFIDLDFFKQYNDNYGHSAGDACLRRVCGVLSDHARRPGDLVARYGGDEFVLVLGNSDEDAATQIINAIWAEVQALNIGHEFSRCSDRVTISIGVATFWPAELAVGSIVDLVDVADASLFEAKGRGRNQVCSNSFTKQRKLIRFGS